MLPGRNPLVRQGRVAFWQVVTRAAAVAVMLTMLSALRVAELVIVPATAGAATVRVTEPVPPAGMSARFQVTSPVAAAPAGIEPTYVVPAGRVSTNTGLKAVPVPVLR